MTCCKFSSGCFLSCDFGNCRAWCRKLDQYRSKISEQLWGPKPKKPQLVKKISEKKSSPINSISKVALDKPIDKKYTDAATNGNGPVDMENDEDDFCDCDNHESASYESLACTDQLVNKTRETVRSMANVLGHLRRQCSLEKWESPRDFDPKKCFKSESKPLLKNSMPSNDKKASSLPASGRKTQMEECHKPQNECGRQISLAAMVDKIKQGVSFLSPGEERKEVLDEKQKTIDKCKLLENLKDGIDEAGPAGNCDGGKHCYVLEKIAGLRNGIAEFHQTLQGIVPRILVLFDRTNRTVVVAPQRPCEVNVKQEKKSN